ncbi:NIPSNAP family protein [Amycolatopsis sp. 195334CR]|uniref:NIPSNAP family protein n=1 Tax=Amycolatopsis sp. 195334CR TaxID=2814588 RepID=UPI001A8DA7CF|nr:NIPSNAP family protein [Amycolatopsis sp. 195334CR]MBN6040863.1 NIPSNAP family protein [Amycolatopsis sp. 195334CR]
MNLPVLELRQYTLRPGRRDELVELFDREFVTGQEACGMRVLGQFRDADDPDRFVWLRGFADLPTRAASLAAFYGGPVWAEHGPAANATMLDSDNVLLLRPAGPDAGFAPVATASTGVYTATICAVVSPGFGSFFAESVSRQLDQPPLAQLETLAVENNFPRLPVREGESVFAWISRFADEESARKQAWRERVDFGDTLAAEPRTLVLHPTAGSALR